MKLIIKNDSKETVKNPNIKIIETTEASFANQTVFIEENDVPIIKYTDAESMYFVKDLDNLYDRKSRSEVLLNITIDNLELIGSGSSEPVDSRPYKVYTALLTQSGTDAPVATVLENTIGNIVWTRDSEGIYSGTLVGAFPANKTFIPPYSTNFSDGSIFLPITLDGNTQTGSFQMYSNVNKVEINVCDMIGYAEWSTVIGTSIMPIEIRVYN